MLRATRVTRSRGYADRGSPSGAGRGRDCRGGRGSSPGPATAAGGAPQCGSGTSGPTGYAYAGHQAASVAHGIRATITPLVRPKITSGHVAGGWVSAGAPKARTGRRCGCRQASQASLVGLVAYAEITRPSTDPKFVELLPDVQPGQRVSVAVLEVAGRPDYWRVWLNGKPGAPTPSSCAARSARWKPIATAESFIGGSSRCNGFGFRFESVGVASSKGGSWRTFVPGGRYLDRGLSVRLLTPVQQGQRALSADAVKPFAFEASAPLGV